MAKAIQTGPKGTVLLPNPENALTFRCIPAKDNQLVNKGGGLVVRSQQEGEHADTVLNPATGMFMRTCPVSMPASWIKELDGPVAYLRLLAGHRRRVRAGQQKAVACKHLDVPYRETKSVQQSRTAERAANRAKRRTLVSPKEVVVPAAALGPLVRDHLLYQDVVLVRCRACKRELLGSGMGAVAAYLKTADGVDGPGWSRYRVRALRESIPGVVAVTVGVGESYCPGCVPGG